MGRPHYHLLGESGPEHRRVFRVEVRLDGDGAEPEPLAEAEGSTKKQAQQEAARLAFAKLAHLKTADATEAVHG
jgi:ribonuclease-3